MRADCFGHRGTEPRTRDDWANRCVLLQLALLIVLGVAGCGAPRPIKYYQITYPTTETVAPDALDVTLLVRPFESSHLYLDDRIAYGFESPEMGMYEGQRWAEPPVEILETALVRGLRASGRFRGVYTPRSNANARYLLFGHLYDFKELDSKGMMARLNYEVRLRDRKTDRTLWNHIYSHDEPATEKTMNAFVLAMNKNLERSVQEVQAGLEEYFRSHPQN
jgi:ABC-type uncharacterized transport system auxiliary subunit